MQGLLATILLFVSFSSFGQEGRWKPFKLLVIQPDTAIIDKTFYPDTDSIVQSQIRRYYQYVAKQEDALKCEGCDSSFKTEIKSSLPKLKALEPEVKKFKYFQLISNYSANVYNFYFNEYEPYSTIIEIPSQTTSLARLKALADSAKADYIIFYNNIHMESNKGLPIFKLTTSLYFRSEDKIIMSKETEGDTDSRGGMWTCNWNVRLSCLLINGVRTSTDEIANVLRERQARRM
ncbi:MAG: hypothetical protein EOP48_28135 [Sphingobacteriales bacterium]|nr:MAG: hypothetical protein EOP48_28135 [Sphingobacteriales bacterium]